MGWKKRGIGGWGGFSTLIAKQATYSWIGASILI